MAERVHPRSMTAPVIAAQAFRRFFEANYMKLRSALAIVCRDPSLADELAQEAMTRVWERWDRVSKMSDPAGYLFRTGMNSLRDRQRAIRRHPERSLEDQAAPDDTSLIDTITALEAAILRLPTRQREALVVTTLLGYRSAPAARILGIRPGTVRRLVSLARERLAADMDTEESDG